MTAIHPEPTRVRKHGCKVTKSANGAERIAACREIVEQSSLAKIDGVTIDLFSASAIIKIYDALNSSNQAMFEKLAIDKMARVAFKLIR